MMKKSAADIYLNVIYQNKNQSVEKNMNPLCLKYCKMVIEKF